MRHSNLRCFIGLLAAVLLLFGGCAKPERENCPEPVSSMPQIQYTGEWPLNSFTAEVPQPATGTVQWVWEHPQGEGVSISLVQATRSGVEQYLQELEACGFRTIEKQLFPPEQTDTVIYLGTNGKLAVSLQYTQDSFGIYLSKNLQGI